MFAELCGDDCSAAIAGLIILVFVILVSNIGWVLRYLDPPLLILAPFFGAFRCWGWCLRFRRLGQMVLNSCINGVFNVLLITHSYGL